MNVRFFWIGGATWILQVDQFRIACDPVLCRKGHVQDYGFFRSKRLTNPVYRKSDLEKIDLWLLTHRHEDHLDHEGILAINNRAKIVAHPGIRPLLQNRPDAVYPETRQTVRFFIYGMNIRIQALPAVHAKNRILGSLVGNGNGYLLKIRRKRECCTVYITGDSVHRKSIMKYFPKGPDLIIANAGAAVVKVPVLEKIIGRITNNNHDIRTMARDLQPKVLIPVHWGTFSHYKEVVKNDSFAGIDSILKVELGKTIKVV